MRAIYRVSALSLFLGLLSTCAAVGPQGPPGAEGPPGAQGKQGEPGPPAPVVPELLPTLTGIEPRQARTEGGEEVTLTGTHFQKGAQVFFDNAAAPILALSDSQITALVPPRLSVQGKVPVRVQNPGYRSAARSDLFRYVSAQVTFAPRLDYPTGRRSQGVAIGDLNGDGAPDLAVAATGDNAVQVLLGDGAGSFGQPSSYGTPAAPFALRIADVNGDDRLDVLVGCAGAVAVLLGSGNGTLQAVANPGTNVADSYFLATGDFNKDGRMDIAAATNSGNGLAVFAGNGDGTFRGLNTYGTGGRTVGAAVGDVNEDGAADVVVSLPNDSLIKVYLGVGDGTFKQAALSYAAPLYTWEIILLDLDQDGHLDLASMNGSGSVSVHRGSGTGAFPSHVKYPYPSSSGGGYLHAAAFNGDGLLDLLTATNLPSHSLFLNRGDGTLGPRLDFQRAGHGTVAAGDINLDGKIDFVAGNDLANSVSVFLNASQ